MTNESSMAAEPVEADLVALLGEVRQAERHLARAVALAGRLAGSGVCERVEGLPLELWLGLAGRLTGADRRVLVAAGETLRSMPTVAGLFADGKLSWGQVRAVVYAARRLWAAERGELDARVAATVAARDGVEGFDPDQLVWAVDAAAEELRGVAAVERAERGEVERSFVAVQGKLGGGASVYAELDAVAAAPVLGALDAAAARPQAGTDGDGGGDGGSGRGRQYAEALVRVCGEWLGGDTRRPARPLLVAHVDVSQASVSPAGTVELGVRGGLARVSAATLEALAHDADVQAVLFDGARPLAVTGKVRAATIPAATRVAVRARDLGCRFPGSADPLAHCDLHHLRERVDGGDHHPDNLVALSRRFHTLVHRHGWKLKIDPDSGTVTAQRGKRTWRSLPRGTPLARAPDPQGVNAILPF